MSVIDQNYVGIDDEYIDNQDEILQIKQQFHDV